ncbi:MAG: ribosome maturation factor RimM [Oscillospiraceae bacterium]
MTEKYLEAGEIINTHGIIGELKLRPYTDSAEFLKRFKTLYMDGKPLEVESSREHKEMLLVKLRGVDDVNAAMRLKGKTLFFDRADAKLAKGEFFLRDIIGARVVTESGAEIGTLTEVYEAPAANVYVVKGETEHLIPVIPEFIMSTDVEAGVVVVRLIEGM